MTEAAIYARISRDTDGNELGVKRQEADCRVLAESRGWAVAGLYVDDDRSAYSGKPRPAYTDLLAAVESRTVGAVIAWHPDRLHRSPRELEDFIDLIERTKCKVATVTAGDYDLTTPAGRMTARVVGAVARGESEHKSTRLRRKHLELAQAGKVPGGGTRPFGFTDDRLHLDRSEAKIVRDLVGRFLAGDTLRSLCSDLNNRAVSTVTGAAWTPHVMRRMLMSGRIAGLREHKREVVATAEWPAIVSPEQHRRVRAILDDPARRKNRAVRGYLLTGTAVCGIEGCGAKLVARPRSDKRRAYVCSTGPGFHGCGQIRALADSLEEFVVEALLSATDSPAIAERVGRPADDTGGDDIAAIEEQVRDLSEMWGSGTITRAEWMAARRPLEARLATARSLEVQEIKSSVLDPYIADGALREAWPGLNLDRQRAVLAAVIERVVVSPAVKGRNFFDPERVSVEWRA